MPEVNFIKYAFRCKPIIICLLEKAILLQGHFQHLCKSFSTISLDFKVEKKSDIQANDSQKRRFLRICLQKNAYGPNKTVNSAYK